MRKNITRFLLVFTVAIMFLCSCATRYTFPPPVYRSQLKTRAEKTSFLPKDFNEFNKDTSRRMKNGKNILVMYVGHDQFENIHSRNFAAEQQREVQNIVAALKNSKRFNEVHYLSFSHIRVESIDHLQHT
jgi:hypothetical protein